MAIVRVPINFDVEVRDVFTKAAALCLEVKQRNEIYAGWSSLKAWRPEFEKNFGVLRAILSRSNSDDPPDLNFEFESASISVEVTDIRPHPYGQAQAIHQREMPNQCVAEPPVSIAYQNKEAIRQAMVSKLWVGEPVGDRRRHLVQAVTEQVNKKAKGLTVANVDLDVLVLYDRSLFNDFDRVALVGGLATKRKNRMLQIPERTFLLIHSESNFLRFRSFLVNARGQALIRSKGYDK